MRFRWKTKDGVWHSKVIWDRDQEEWFCEWLDKNPDIIEWR